LIRLEARLVLAGVRHETVPAYATHHAARHRAMLRPPILRQSPEGQVNRLKTLKRQMYGRANLDLLEHRFLLAS